MKRTRPDGLFLGILASLLVGLLAAPLPSAVPGSRSTPGVPPTSTLGPAPTQAATPTHLAVRSLTPTSDPTPAPPPAATSRPNTGRTPAATRTPTAAPSPTAPPGTVIGYSVEGRPLTAVRFGQGPLKVVLVGDIHGGFEANTYELARQLVAHFQAHPGDVPAGVSLWIVPTMNPDGLAAGSRYNANGVDLNRNADTDMDGCAGNDWSPDTSDSDGRHPGAGGSAPFSEPEARAVRDFIGDAWIAVFYHSAARAIYVDSCQRHAPTTRLAEILSEASGYPVPPAGWTSYPLTGDWGDYLAGEGVAAATVELTDHEDPELERNLAGVRALLAAAGEVPAAEASSLTWLAPDKAGNVGSWQYTAHSFVHPLSLEVVGPVAYLLDGGRVLRLALDEPAAPQVLLAPGDSVENVRVLEPLDLATSGEMLLVLDRAGDVYRYEPRAETWTVERYDRPSGASGDHYFVALAGGDEASYLLETTHEQVWRFAGGQKGSAWTKLPQSRDVDLSAGRDGVYVLTRALNNPAGSLLRYVAGRQAGGFRPGLSLMHPRQVRAAGDRVYVLDRAGRRLVALQWESGSVAEVYQFADRRPVSAFWAGEGGERLILAGSDALYFVAEPERQAVVDGGPAVLDGPLPHDLALWTTWAALQMPLAGAHLTSRDFQFPGAPRHYRLGVHEGMDFYGHTVGVAVDRSSQVRAVADGVVVRAMVDYQPLTAAQAQSWAAQCQASGYTPPEVLDGYRGRQVWIEHEGGLVSRYAHLGSIAAGIVDGAAVRQGQVIATVGNSGTPSSISSQTIEVHLHLELWLNDHYIGQFLRPIEAREWLEKILR